MNRRDIIDYLSHLDAIFAPKSGPTVVNPRSKVPVHPWGPGYSIHPELTRSGSMYLLMRALPPVGVVTVTVGSAYFETKNIEAIASNESTPSWWKSIILSGM